MNFGNEGRRSGRKRRIIHLTGNRNEELYQHVLQLYTVPPIETITLQEFEELAIKRVQVLRIVEAIGVKHLKSNEEYRSFLSNELKKQNFHAYTKRNVTDGDLTNDLYDERRKDHISHFILRLAYCRTEELRKWFMTQEIDLFRYRLNGEMVSSIKDFLKLNQMNYDPIGKNEKESILSNLLNSSYIKKDNVLEMEFFKVHFTEALDLVSCRRVYLRNGYAYIPVTDLKTIIVNTFRMQLSRALATTIRVLPELEEDDRLLRILKNVNLIYVGKDYNSTKNYSSGKVNPDMIDSLANTSFPLCMKSLHEMLRQNHHLRHGGRMQYGLFLKAIGLNLEDALAFWRNEFLKLMDSDKFDKQYSYNVRHNYGKEGKRANYTPYSCMKIITSNQPGPGDTHGCPFKHSDTALLIQRLQSLSISQKQIQEIKDYITKGHYQLACTQYFEATHNASLGQAVSHPNYYFDESQKVKNGITLTDQGEKYSTVKSQLFSKEENNELFDYNMDITEEEMETILKSSS